MLNKKLNFFRGEKSGISIPIVVIVLSTILLVVMSIFYFVVNKNSSALILDAPNVIDSVYLDEAYLNYYLNDIFEKSLIDFSKEEGADIFLERFKENLYSYKDPRGNYVFDPLYNIELNLSSSDIEVTEDKLKMDISIVLEKNLISDKGEVISVKYNYKKNLEKVFKGENPL